MLARRSRNRSAAAAYEMEPLECERGSCALPDRTLQARAIVSDTQMKGIVAVETGAEAVQKGRALGVAGGAGPPALAGETPWSISRPPCWR